jgi:hypothetical protein
MIRHIVMFRLREFDSPKEKQHAAETVRKTLLKLKTTIPVIREFEVGINNSTNPDAFDLVINSSFASKEDLSVYQLHPDHQAFILFNKNYTEKKTVVDYEY